MIRINESFVEEIELSRDLDELKYILEYVYSYGSQRASAIKRLEKNIPSIFKSVYANSLPTNYVVHRWFDFRSNRKEVLDEIENKGFYECDYTPYSYSLLKPERLISVTNRSSYGLVIKKDLSNLSGSHVEVYNILKYLSNKSNLKELVKLAIDKYNTNLLEFLYNIGIISEIPSDEFDVDDKILHPEEVAFIDQKEILVISQETKFIRKDEVELIV